MNEYVARKATISQKQHSGGGKRFQQDRNHHSKWEKQLHFIRETLVLKTNEVADDICNEQETCPSYA